MGALIVVALTSSAAAQQTPDAPNTYPIVSEVRPLVVTPTPFPLVEPYLAVNPRDSDELLVSAMSTSAAQAVVYGSWDGGDSWEQVSTFPGGHPTVTFGGDGRAYFASIAPEIHVWRSENEGRTWAGPAVIDSGHAADREWLAASPNPSAGKTPLLVAAAEHHTSGQGPPVVFVLSVSRDGGATFEPPTFSPPDSGYLNSVTGLGVRDDGTVLMPYLVNYAQVSRNPPLIRGRRWIRISRDGGESWPEVYQVAENLQYGNASWDRATKGFGGGALAADESDGPHHGTLYLTWSAVLDGYLQIVVAHSTDGGRTWGEPMRVNDGGYRSDHSTPTVAVNRAGVVAVTWNDRRDDRRQLCFRHFVALSADGGRTFGPNRPVADRQTCPGAGSRWLNGGDTQGLIALPDESFRTVWSVGRGQNLRLWTAVIRTR